MKSRLLLCCSVLMLASTTQAGLIYSPANPVNANIPDGSALGWSGTATASGFLQSITAVTVNLNISGGYNGDLYAYLSYGGVLVPLLNRVGVTSGDAFGYGTAGMHVTLADGYTDIHTVEFPTLNGTYSPDGRNIDPQSSPGSFDTASRVNFGAFGGLNPNGTWTLFIADLSAGAQSQLVSWTLDITAEVPEPVNAALLVFASVLGLGGLWHKLRARAHAR
jgi:subtilisin-like proprotein convertase family protein